jgi:uncharacterized protein (DUF1800 family)
MDDPTSSRPSAPPMRRRRLLICSGALACGTGLLPGCVTAPPHPTPPRPASPSTATGSNARGGLDAADLAFVNRVTWGIDGTAAAQWLAGSRETFLQGQLHPVPAVLPAPVQAQIDALTIVQTPLETLVAQMDQRRHAADSAATEDARKEARQSYQQELTRLGREAASRMLLRAQYASNQLQEQLTWFWFNHFNVHQYKGELRAMVGDYEDRLRRHALGHFRDLLVASATHAAMIRYLDNAQNAANRINENYARELMELHTLGVDAGYTQKDVQELARVLTGLGVRVGEEPPRLRPAWQTLYVRDGQLTRLAREPATARHVCRKLAIHFVADVPPPALVERMARAFETTDGDIAATLQALFSAPQFASSLGHKFKDPVHYVVSATRLAGDGRTGLNTSPMLGWLTRLGEAPYNRQTPDGYPLDEAAWASSGQMNTRFEIARAIGKGNPALFRSEDGSVDQHAAPQIANTLYRAGLEPTLGPATRAALDAAASPQEWNTVLLSSPEFMYR